MLPQRGCIKGKRPLGAFKYSPQKGDITPLSSKVSNYFHPFWVEKKTSAGGLKRTEV